MLSVLGVIYKILVFNENFCTNAALVPGHLRCGIHGLSATASDYSRKCGLQSILPIYESVHDKFVRSGEWSFDVYRCNSGWCAVWIVFQEMAHLLLNKMSLVHRFINSMTNLLAQDSILDEQIRQPIIFDYAAVFVSRGAKILRICRVFLR